MKAAARDRDLVALGVLAALVALRFGPDWLRGLGTYWGDLTYIHLPWRVFDAQSLMAGRLPSWNPYLYLGMPQSAAMQDGLFYPGSAPFWLFGFSTAAAVFQAVHYWLAGGLCYLALRSMKAPRHAALGGAILFCLGGLLMAREGFLNHLAVLSLMPALVLFFGRPALLAVALAVSFWAGYPTFLVGACLSAWAMRAAAPGRVDARRQAAGWIGAGALAALLAGCLVAPAFELLAQSRRASGVDAVESLTFAFKPGDLLLWIRPPRGFSAAVDWWKSCHLGWAGLACVCLGLAALPARRALAWLAVLAAVLALTLAGSNAVSTWLWLRLPGLRFVRYPGNVAYLALLPLSALAAAGLRRGGPRLALAAAMAAELLLLARGALPRAPRELLSSAGPLARRLQTELGGHRYAPSPRAIEAVSGSDVYDWRHRLYGLTNAPLKLRSAGNFGEPLVPRANYDFMDALFSARGPGEALEPLRWADVAALLTPAPVTAAGFTPRGRTLWDVASVSGAAGARLLPRRPAAALAQAGPAGGRALEVERPREDAWSVRGDGAGWLFVAEPLYPGWVWWIETAMGPGSARAFPAVGPFQAVSAPSGAWTVHARYDPASARWGLAATLLAGWALAAYWYNRLRNA
jgi:hypothetical protein